MADVDDDEEGFTFGDFVFAPPSPRPQPQPIHVNGVSLSSPKHDFFGPATDPAHHNPHPPFKRVDPDPFVFSKPKGALPLSLFGQLEAEDDEDKGGGKIGKVDDLNHHGFDFDFNFNTNNGKLNGGFDPNTATQNGNGPGLDLNNHDHEDEDDEEEEGEDDWEFKGAFSGNHHSMHANTESYGHGASAMVSGGGVEQVVVTPLENQAGQDVSSSTALKPGFSSLSLQSDDLFAVFPKNMNKSNGKDATFDAFPGTRDIGNRSISASNSVKHGSSESPSPSNDLFLGSFGAVNKSTETDDGSKSSGEISNGFTWDAFSGIEKISNGSQISGPSAVSVELKPHLTDVFLPFDPLRAAPLEAVNKSSEPDVDFNPSMTSSLGFHAFPGIEEIHNRSAINASSSSSAEQKPDSSSFLFPSNNLFEVAQGAVGESSETFGAFKRTSLTTNGFLFDAFPEVKVSGNGSGGSATASATTINNDDFGDFKKTSVTTNGFLFDAFPEIKVGGKGSGTSSSAAATVIENDDLDDFGDFVDASQEDKPKEQDKQTLPLSSREALPLSLFGDSTEESSETMNHPDELFHKHTSNPENGFSGQTPIVSIHDLITNLYSQAQSTQSAGSNIEPAENGVHDIQKKASPSLAEEDEWDDNSWEFKGAFQEAGVREQPSSAIRRNAAQIQLKTSPNVQAYINLYVELRNSLCFLLSCQLDELQNTRCPVSENGFATEITETLDNEIQNAHKLLEQGVVSHIVSEKYLEKSNCLNEVVKILEDPMFEMIESEFSVSKKLQLAVNDWRVTADLLRHAISILKILSLGSADEQNCYVSTWSNIINICAQELRCGALVWKKASEMKVKRQVLSDCRGQKHIQALGEIYKVVELIGLSAKVYKAWMLFSVSDSSPLTGLLNECHALWSSSGLEETLKTLSDDIGFGCDETTKALPTFIKNIRDVDVGAVYECVFDQHKSICWLSLLPQEMLPDVKTVMWNEEPYFLGLANLWANLISLEPPQLPHVQII